MTKKIEIKEEAKKAYREMEPQDGEELVISCRMFDCGDGDRFRFSVTTLRKTERKHILFFIGRVLLDFAKHMEEHPAALAHDAIIAITERDDKLRVKKLLQMVDDLEGDDDEQ